MSFPEKGKKFPDAAESAVAHVDEGTFAEEIAKALQRELGHSRAAAKTAVTWTGASDRAAKNWLHGRYGPSGAHLISLARHSDAVLHTILVLSGRQELIAAKAIADARAQLRVTRALVDDLLRALGDDDTI